MLASWKKNDDKPRQGIKKQRHHFANKAMLFPVVMYRCESRTNKAGWVPKNWCFPSVVLEKALERLQGDQTSQSSRKSTLSIYWKDWCWSWSSSTLATWCKQPTCWKRRWCWERLRAGEEGDDRGWDGWMASLTQRTWVRTNSGR